jgi:sodium/potassium-transporting ATPase subunit alpha
MRVHIGNIVKKKLEKPKPCIDLDYHKLTFEQLVERFDTSLTKGLNDLQATNLLIKNGKNVLKQKKKNLLVKILGYLFTGFCALLWVSSLVCFLAWKPIGDPPDSTNFGLAILLIVVIMLQAAFSAFQDWSSNKVMKSIKNMMPHFATVIRNGIEHKIPVEEVVVGDLVHLSYGNKVPADIRIIESHDLKFDKSMLTGESEAIEGTVECTDERYVESKNIAYMTTLVTNGQGKGIVVAIGSQTIMGKIASLTDQTAEKKTSLQKEITRYVYYVSFVASLTVVILIIIWSSLIRVKYPNYINTANMMVNSIAVFCAFIPTGKNLTFSE